MPPTPRTGVGWRSDRAAIEAAKEVPPAAVRAAGRPRQTSHDPPEFLIGRFSLQAYTDSRVIPGSTLMSRGVYDALQLEW